MDFCHSREIYPKKNREKIGYCYKKVVHETTEATGEPIGNKIAEKNVQPKTAHDDNSRNVKEIVIPLAKEKTRNIKQIKTSIIK